MDYFKGCDVRAGCEELVARHGAVKVMAGVVDEILSLLHNCRVDSDNETTQRIVAGVLVATENIIHLSECDRNTIKVLASLRMPLKKSTEQ